MMMIGRENSNRIPQQNNLSTQDRDFAFQTGDAMRGCVTDLPIRIRGCGKPDLAFITSVIADVDQLQG